MSSGIRSPLSRISFIPPIAYIHGDDTSVTKNRLGSFYRTLQRLGIEEPDEYVKPSFYRDADLAGERTGELLDLKDPPTCILYPDDYAAMGEKKYLKWYNKIGYGSGDIAGNVVYAFLTSFMMPYLTDSVGLAAGHLKFYYPFTYGTRVNWNRNNTSSNRYRSNTTGPQLLEPIPFNA